MKIRFLGGAGTVTGSRTLVRSRGRAVLVDCGMFQGFKQLRLRNWQRLEVDPASIEAVILTHAHLDHSGWLPALVRDGFRGRIHCTAGTADLLGILLPDSGRIQEEDASHANRKKYSKHDPARPLYTEADAMAVLDRLAPADWEQPVAVGPLTATFHPAGHILGAASVCVGDGITRVLFSGDLGRPHDLLMAPPASACAADHVVIESTYGGRTHEEGDVVEALAEVVRRTMARGGTLLIPSFAVGRAQSVLWALHVLREAGRIPDVPVHLDSPMAFDTTQIFRKHPADLRIDDAQMRALCRGVRFARTVDDSKAIDAASGPAIVVSASGMLTGGRVLHHLAHMARSPNNTLLFVGYQAPGTRGARLLAREPRVKIHGRYVPVHCEVAEIGGFSAHADANELMAWLRTCPNPPRRVWINHGEPASADALRQRIEEELGWEVVVATEGEEIELAPATEGAPVPTPPRQLSNGEVTADQDLAFLARDDMRAIQLLLEYTRVDKTLDEHGIGSTVVVFGSTRIHPSEPADRPLVGEADYYEMARRFGQIVGGAHTLAGTPVALVTGGGGGIMEAANRGAFEVGAPSIGLNIELPREQHPNPYVTEGLSLRFRYFALRKMHFLARARALVAFPGGYGTFDELFDALCLIQTRKLPRIPVVLVGSTYWDAVFPGKWFTEAGLIGPEDADLVEIVDSAEQAWECIRRFHEA